MRTVVALTSIALIACASGNVDPTASGRPESQAIVRGANLRMTAAAKPHVTTVAFSVDPVWRALPAVYDSLGLPLTVMDTKQHLIGNQGVTLRQKLGGVRLSKYIECGNAQIGLSADSYDVFLSVVTHVRPNDPVGTDIVTTVDAAAKPMTFSQEYSRCSTTGEIEKRIAELVTATFLRK